MDAPYRLVQHFYRDSANRAADGERTDNLLYRGAPGGGDRYRARGRVRGRARGQWARSMNVNLPVLAAPTGSLTHPSMGPVNYRLDMVSDEPDAQVAEVIGLMRTYALADAQAPVIQETLRQIILADGDPITGIFRHVQGRMAFVSDEETAAPLQPACDHPIVEVLVRPVDIATPQGVQHGDCDDYTMYGAALLLAARIPCSFVTVAADPNAPDIFSHVYLAAYPTTGPYAGQRVPLDLSHGPRVGWETEHQYRRQEWPVTPVTVTATLLLAVGAALLYHFSTKGRT
jgi:hypothetical protein